MDFSNFSIYTLQQKVKNHPVFFCKMREVTRNALLVIFHYGLDHGLQFESYLKLIKKSNCWLLQMEKRG
jgi:hypothetical protein